ncbi:hypothetical protein D6779_09175 [Candidatus Parcubacteria bacterium]|nr:MAG: hypothetical protein D6779_09175 [Candidatus Parcubacteria bacterium]
MSKKKFPASVSRRIYWSDEVGGCTSCPQCGDKIESEFHSYEVSIERGTYIESYVLGTDAGYFCKKCPIVVINRDEFNLFIKSSLGMQEISQYSVDRVIDIDDFSEDEIDDDELIKDLIEIGDIIDYDIVSLTGESKSTKKRKKVNRRRMQKESKRKNIQKKKRKKKKK